MQVGVVDSDQRVHYEDKERSAGLSEDELVEGLARELDDARFATVLAFTRQAFESALLLTAPTAAARPEAAAGRSKTRSARPRRADDDPTAAPAGRD